MFNVGKLKNFFTLTNSEQNKKINALVDELKKNARYSRKEHRQLVVAFEELRMLYNERVKNDKLFQSLSEISLILLRYHNVGNKFDDVCEKVGLAANVNRCYIFKNSKDEERTSLISEWCDTNNCSPQINNENLQNVSFEAVPWFRNAMFNRKCIYGSLNYFPDNDIKENLSKDSVKSILICPINTNGHCWGFMGLDSVESERLWSESERSVISSICNMLGAAIYYRIESIADSEHSMA